MKDFTIFRTGSQRGVNTFLLGEGAIEHPMSTHSAPFGTSWKARGLRYVASILMILTLCVGNAWGAYYGTGRVVAVRFGGNDVNFGKVGCKVGTSTSNTYDGEYGVDITASIGSVTYRAPQNNNNNGYILCFAQEVENSGYTFAGWYTDSSCETPAENFVSNYGPTTSCYAYRFDRSTIPQSTANNSKAKAVVMQTLYAKFVKGSTTNKFQTQLTVSTESTSKGVVDVSKTGVKPLGSSVYAYDINGEHATTRGKDTRTVTGDVVETESTDTFQTYYVYAQALRGYQFKKWTPGTSVTLASADYCGTGSNCYLSAYKVSIDNQATKTNGVYGLTGTLTAEFESITANKNFSIKKEKDKGAVIGFYSNWYYDGSSKVGRKGKVDDLAGLGSSDETRSYSNFYSTDEVTLTATPAEDFLVSGWVLERESKPDSFLTTSATLTTSLFENGMVFRPVFVPDPSSLNIDENDYFLVGNSTCTSFEQALSAATQGQHKTILQLQDYTVPAGNYTIPAGVTLLIPYAADQVAPATILPRVENQNATDGVVYRTLTLSSGVHLDVYGTIEVSGQQATGLSAAGGEVGIGCPTGGYGCMHMSAGSSITLNDGALLRGWGFVLGDRDGQGKYQCEIDARRGSIVREQFQIMDWKGGTYTMGMTDGINSNVANPNAHKVLPINQYYIQNVEVPVKYRPGAKLQANASVFLNGSVSGKTFKNITFNIDNVGIIGAKYTYSQDAAIFLMNDEDDSEDTWVRKYYDPATDQQVYEINNSAYLGSLELTVLGGVKVSSTEYKLPITNNFKIHLLNGEMEITQHTEFLAGSELIVNKKSTMTIPSGVNVFLYDKEEWGNYISATRNENSTFTMRNGTTVRWRPGGRPIIRRDAKGAIKIEDAKFTVSGTLNVEGKLFTTTHGATIISTNEDAGTVMFSADAPANYTVSQINSLPADASHSGAFTRIACTSAQLMNKDSSLTKTYTDADHHAVSGQSYCFINGAWRSFVQEDQCFISKTVAEVKTYYAKPQDLVALSSGVEDENHLFYSSDGSRTFIHAFDIAGNCQWWEVTATATPGIYHCEHPKNDKYYYYSGGDWLEKKFKVSWVNWDGSPVNYTNSENERVNYYMVSYNTTPQWLSANPTRAHDASHEYTFDGWMPTPAAVTKDVTYMAQFKERDRMYAITFNDENDELIQVLYCKLGEMPVCDKFELEANQEWQASDGSPLGAVSKDETYHPVAKNVDGPFTIKFVNWDGEPLQSSSVEMNATPTYNTAVNGTPSKPADVSHSYVFVGWTPAIAPATQNMTYTAKYEVEQISGLNVNTASTLTSDMTVPEVRITTTGSLNITSTAVLTTTNLILEATSDASGQLDAAAENKIDATNVYFDWMPNGNDGTASRTWYAIAVPWEVDAENGIFLKETGRHLVIGQDFDLIYYDGATRALQGNKPACWKYVQHDEDKIMHPGRLYMMYFDPGFKTIRFAKKTGSAVLYMDPVNVSTYTEETGNSGIDANWNGIANPKTYYASLSAGTATYAQVLNNGNLDDYFADPGVVYQTINLASSKFTVGKPLFVQATEATSVVVTKQTTAGIVNAAPRRAAAELPKGIAAVYRLAIAGKSEPEADNLFVQVAEDEKADRYTIGQDLVKGGVASGRAQVWVSRYDAKLSVNTQALSEDEATYPLTIQVPANGEYVLSVGANENEDYALYLTRDGEAIWNLSDGDYIGSFEKGTTSEYGLRVSAKVPQIATGIDEAVVDAKGETRKVLINDQVFIIRGENVYSVDGQLVK